MLASLLADIENPQLTSAFYLASDVDWLYRQIVGLPAVQTLQDLVTHDPVAAAALVERTLELFAAPTEPGCLSEYEVPLCCYAFVLARQRDERARRTLHDLAAQLRPAHGWLVLLMTRYLQDSVETQRRPAVTAP